MLCVVFVHGTGVREEAYKSSVAKIDKQLHDRFGIAATQCYWGGQTRRGLAAAGRFDPNLPGNPPASRNR